MQPVIQTIEYLSDGDDTMQPALFQQAEGDTPRPLLVVLHTWSADLTQPCQKYATRCARRNWHMIYPLFRGENWKKEACGSDLAVADIASAVAYAKTRCKVDPKRVYLLGGSGGGHASLLLAARHPELWTAVSSWCPISDIGLWHLQRNNSGKNEQYAEHIRMACGGDPQRNAAAAAEAALRSPVTYLKAVSGKVIVDVGTGIHDGHTGSVPIGQAVRAFNLLADPADAISEEEIVFMEKNEQIPPALAWKGPEDPAYGPYKVLLRRISRKVRLTLFEGSHDLLPGPAMAFLENQVAGQEAVWSSGTVYDAEPNRLGQ